MSDRITIVTPTRRLSRHLRFQYAREQLQKGHLAWQTLDSLPWNAWCRRLYEQSLFILKNKPLLLGDNQQLWIWQDIINRSRYRDRLLQVNATAKQALHAYRLCQQWAIPIFPDDVFLSEDALAFKSWANAYAQLKRENQWLDEASLADYLVEHIKSINISAPVQFQGFDVLTKQQQKLIDALAEHGVNVELAQAVSNKQTISVYAAADKQDEIRAAACWARDKLSQNTNARIGIITPRLKNNRTQIIRAFASVLTPNSVLTPVSPSNQVWSVALGKALLDYPMIDTALALLALGQRRVSTEKLTRLLHSRFIKGGQEEISRRALFDAALRQSGIDELSLKSLYRFAEQVCDEDIGCEQFIQLLKDFEISFLSRARKHSLRQWAIHFSEWLTLFGWPGEHGLNSVEHQTLLAWQSCLNDFGQLDPSGRGVSYPVALSQLRRLVSDSQFQPETPETPVQIAGLDGSAGMQFDHLWILDMQDDYWPEQSVPNAFVPNRLQQHYGVPEASAESRLQWARKVTDQLLHSSVDIVLSFARQEGDRECRPSPLIGDWVEAGNRVEINSIHSPAARIFESGKMEQFTDTDAPPIAAGKVASGGSALFRDQSLCPFRAFARHRLHATSLALTDIGLSAADRGNLTHRALQYLWQRLGDQERLLYLSDNERNKLIQSVVNEAIKQHALQQPEIFTERFTLLEQRRLEQLLQQWLFIERERSPFKVIATEDWQTVRFHDLELHLRIDRVDELADGRCVIIDYKTGQVRKSDWESDNPNDPQLPLYAVTADRQVAAVAFASLKPGELKYLGQAEADGILPGVRADENRDWTERLAEWQQVLTRLASDFRAGKATVEPLLTACRYCDLQPLCRIYERAETLDAESVLEGDSGG